MGKLQNKYHIAENGTVYKVNEDGSFTSMGNINDLTKGSAPKESSSQKWKVLAVFFLVVICCMSYGCWYYFDNSEKYEQRYYNLRNSIFDNDVRINGERMCVDEYGNLISETSYYGQYVECVDSAIAYNEHTKTTDAYDGYGVCDSTVAYDEYAIDSVSVCEEYAECDSAIVLW